MLVGGGVSHVWGLGVDASMPETLNAMETVSAIMTHHKELHKSSTKVQGIGKFLLVATFQPEMSCMVSGRL